MPISSEKLEGILAEHKEWIATAGKKGAQAVLDRADLQKADLRGACLDRAVLRHADLSGADLRDLDAEHPTRIRGADFGGADLTDARLPDSIRSCENLDYVKEASKNCRQLLVVLTAAAAYALLTLASTSDADLVTGAAVLPLPVFADVRVPTRLFYTFGPLILLGSFIHLHLYLSGMWRMVAGFPARFRDGTTLDAQLYPWLVMSIVTAHFPRLRAEARRPTAQLARWISVLAVWWGIPAVLFVFWVVYLPRRDTWGTFVQVCALGLGLAWALLSLWHTRRTLDGGNSEGNFVTAPFRTRSWGPWVATAMAAVLLGLIGYVSWATIQGELAAQAADLARRTQCDRTDGRLVSCGFRSVIGRVLLLPIANLSYKELAGNYGKTDRAGADLRSRDLRYCLARRVSMVKAILEDARLDGARLEEADLTESDLRRASLKKATLSNVILKEARLGGADLQEAELSGANLVGAILSNANLQGVAFVGAMMQRASLFAADLTNAKLIAADLRGADLGQAQGLVQDQLDTACTDRSTILPNGLKANSETCTDASSGDVR